MGKRVWLTPSKLDDVVLCKHLGMPDEGYEVLLTEGEYLDTEEYRLAFFIDAEGLDNAGREVFSTRDSDALDYVVVPASVVKEESYA